MIEGAWRPTPNVNHKYQKHNHSEDSILSSNKYTQLTVLLVVLSQVEQWPLKTLGIWDEILLPSWESKVPPPKATPPKK